MACDDPINLTWHLNSTLKFQAQVVPLDSSGQPLPPTDVDGSQAWMDIRESSSSEAALLSLAIGSGITAQGTAGYQIEITPTQATTAELVAGRQYVSDFLNQLSGESSPTRLFGAAIQTKPGVTVPV